MNEKVFLSSTFRDNEERRKLALDAIVRARMTPIGMEYFTADARPAVEVCLDLARSCDVYVGIVAYRYGWIPDGGDRSITELEYDAAKAAGRPRLMFEIDRSFRPRIDEDFDEGPDRWRNQDRLDAFKARYRADQTPAPFVENTLAVKILQALIDWRGALAGLTTPASAAVAGAVDLAGYRAALERLYSSAHLAGFKTRLRVPIDLAELYVPLQAMVDRRSVESGDYRNPADAERALRDAGDVPEIALAEALRIADIRGLSAAAFSATVNGRGLSDPPRPPGHVSGVGAARPASLSSCVKLENSSKGAAAMTNPRVRLPGGAPEVSSVAESRTPRGLREDTRHRRGSPSGRDHESNLRCGRGETEGRRIR